MYLSLSYNKQFKVTGTACKWHRQFYLVQQRYLSIQITRDLTLQFQGSINNWAQQATVPDSHWALTPKYKFSIAKSQDIIANGESGWAHCADSLSGLLGEVQLN